MNISSIVTDTTTAKKVPRPLNCFMTYRLEKQREILQQCPGTNHRDISKITAKWWKEMTVAEKEPYRIKARNAKFEHEKMYPNYKFNPKKKITKTRPYKKRTEEAFTAQDFEQQHKLSLLYHEGMKAKLSSSPAIEYNIDGTLISDNVCSNMKEDICCATCFSSSATSRNCFSSKPHSKIFHSLPSQSVSPSPSSPYTVSGYYEDPNLNYSQLYPPHHYYGSVNNHQQQQQQQYQQHQQQYQQEQQQQQQQHQQHQLQQQQTYNSFQSPFRVPPINKTTSSLSTGYYSEVKDINNNNGNRNFHSLIHSGYNHSPVPAILSPPTFYYH